MNSLMSRREALKTLFTGSTGLALARTDSATALGSTSIAPTIDTPLEAKRKVFGLLQDAKVIAQTGYDSGKIADTEKVFSIFKELRGLAPKAFSDQNPVESTLKFWLKNDMHGLLGHFYNAADLQRRINTQTNAAVLNSSHVQGACHQFLCCMKNFDERASTLV